MKKIILAVLILLIKLVAFGQSNEVEPNNSFATASPLLYGDPTTATTDATDTIDYHGLDFDYNANFYLIITVTNTGTSGTQQLDLTIFNTFKVNDEYVGNFYITGYQLSEGAGFSDTIRICGLARDSFYLRFKSHGQFEYTMEWYAANTYDDNIFYSNNLNPRTHPKTLSFP